MNVLFMLEYRRNFFCPWEKFELSAQCFLVQTAEIFVVNR